MNLHIAQIRTAARHRWQTKVVWRWWSLQNWRKGYRFGPIQRCRWCDHTSPSHYPTCRTIPCEDPS